MAHSDQHARSVLPSHVGPARGAVFRNTTLAGWPTPVQAIASQRHGGGASGVPADEGLGVGATIKAFPGLQAQGQAAAINANAIGDIWA